MGKQLKPYDKYMETGILWVPRVPAHWKITRNKNVMKLKKELVGSDHGKYTLLSLTLKGIIPRDMKNPKGKFPKDFSTYQAVDINDLVFCLFDIDETPRTVGLAPLSGMITGAYTIFSVFDNTNAKFLYYFYLSMDNSKSLKPLYTGLRKVITSDTFLRTKLPLPPLEEQLQIVKYLDKQLTKIDRFIKGKQKLISLLKEQIELCLYGNRNVIESWDNAFPPDWLLIKANRIFKEIKISNCPDKELLAVTQDKGVIFKKDSEKNFVSPSGDLSGLKLVREGDFVISLRSFQGGIEHSEIEGIVSPAYNVFSLREDYRNEEYNLYYKYLFKTKAFISILNTLVSGIRDGKNINYSDFSKIKVPVPPKETIKELLSFIKQYEIIKEQFEKEFKILSEYRIRLISDVVTGNVDVRHIEIDEVSEDEDIFELEEVLEGEECEV